MPHQKTPSLWTWLAWSFLFTPALMEGQSPTSVALWLASVCLFSCVWLWRPLLGVAMAALIVLGGINVVHIGFLGNLADQFFLATVLRTNWQESQEFVTVLPWAWVAGALLWMALAGMAARLVWRHAHCVRQPGWSRNMASMALLVWLLFGAFVLIKRYDFGQVVRKVKTLYPMHIVWAWTAHAELNAAIFYTPQLPQQAPAATQVDTLVVVLGESASAQRWSMLGYEGADTNAPLQALEGVQVVRAMAHGLNTAATLPFLLTGLDAQASVQQRAASFLDLAQQAGYKTFVISNSRYHSAVEDFYGVTLRRAADVFLKAGNGAWDDVLTPHLDAALRDPAPRKLVVLHTYGSHFQVQERYPADSAPFKDAYDNSLHYTSRLLADWVQRLARSAGTAQSAMLLYSSDHGMAMPPCADHYRTGSGLSSLQVPLMRWSNARWQAQSAALLPDFSADGRLQVQRSQAALADMAATVVGYPQGLVSDPSSAASTLAYQGQSWSDLQKADACTLQ